MGRPRTKVAKWSARREQARRWLWRLERDASPLPTEQLLFGAGNRSHAPHFLEKPDLGVEAIPLSFKQWQLIKTNVRFSCQPNKMGA